MMLKAFSVRVQRLDFAQEISTETSKADPAPSPASRGAQP